MKEDRNELAGQPASRQSGFSSVRRHLQTADERSLSEHKCRPSGSSRASSDSRPSNGNGNLLVTLMQFRMKRINGVLAVFAGGGAYSSVSFGISERASSFR